MIEKAAKDLAKKVCAVIKDDGKRAVCVELLTKAFVHGDSFEDELRKEMERSFTKDERKLIKEELSKLLEG